MEIEKSNVLLIGPTGSGKTFGSAHWLNCLMFLLLSQMQATLTEAGYVGDDVENIVLRLLQAADHDIERAQCGIVYVDEIDKIGRKTDNVSITRDVSGKVCSRHFLKSLKALYVTFLLKVEGSTSIRNMFNLILPTSSLSVGVPLLVLRGL